MPPTDRSDSFDGLPDVLREIAEVAGLPAAIALARDHGGTRVKIPRRIRSANHWLARCVGEVAAAKICAHYAVTDADGHEVGNCLLYMPQAGTGVIAQAVQQLGRDLARGLSARAAARRAGLTERAAYRMRAKMRDGAQIDLFGPGAASPPPAAPGLTPVSPDPAGVECHVVGPQAGMARSGPGLRMILRTVLQVALSILRSVTEIAGILRVLQKQGSTIMTKLDDLKAADTAEATAVTDALAAIKTLSEQHQADLAKLAAQSAAGDDVGPLVTTMQARAQSLNDAVTALHATMTAETSGAASTSDPATAPGAANPAPAPAADPAPAPAANAAPAPAADTPPAPAANPAPVGRAPAAS